jgi:hypothetical protein
MPRVGCCVLGRHYTKDVRFEHEGAKRASFIESSVLTLRNRNNKHVKANGRLTGSAYNVYSAKTYFIRNHVANQKLINFEKDIATNRNNTINRIRDYEIKLALDNVEELDIFEKDDDNFIDLFEEVRLSISCSLNEAIETKIALYSDGDLKLRDKLHSMISSGKVKNLEKSDLANATLLLLKNCETPKAMRFAGKFIKFLINNQYIKKQDYIHLREVLISQIKDRLAFVLEAVYQGDKNTTEVVSNYHTSLIEKLYNIEGYSIVLNEIQRTFRGLTGYIKAKASSTRKILDIANHSFRNIFNDATDIITKTVSTIINDRESSDINKFIQLEKSLLLAISILNTPFLQRYDQTNYDRFLNTLSNQFIKQLASHTELFMRNEISSGLAKDIIYMSYKLHEKDERYPSIYDNMKSMKSLKLKDAHMKTLKKAKTQKERQRQEISREVGAYRDEIVAVAGSVIASVTNSIMERSQAIENEYNLRDRETSYTEDNSSDSGSNNHINVVADIHPTPPPNLESINPDSTVEQEVLDTPTLVEENFIVDNNDRCNEATQNSQVAINRSSQEESSETQPLLPSRSNNNETEINDVSASSNISSQEERSETQPLLPSRSNNNEAEINDVSASSNSPNSSGVSNLGMEKLRSLMQGVDLTKEKKGLKKVKKPKYLE